jgi:hypothetical protein
MANEKVADLPVRVWNPLNGPVRNDIYAQSNDHFGLRLLKSDESGFLAMFTLGEIGTVNATWSVVLALTDDGSDSADLGKVLVVGVTIKLIADGETLAIGTSGGTEVTASVTLDATTKKVELNTIASVGIDSMTEPTTGLIRVRRIGSNASDTLRGTALLHHVAIINA